MCSLFIKDQYKLNHKKATMMHSIVLVDLMFVLGV